MIHLIGFFLAGTGTAAAPYIKKAFKKIKKARLDEEEIKEEVNEGTALLKINTEEDSDIGVKKLTLSTGILGVATIAQFSIVWLTPVSLFLIGYTSANIIKEATTAIFVDKKVKVDILDAVVISLSILFGQFAAAAFMVWILDLADILLEKTKRKSEEYITDIFGKQARFAWLLVDGQEIEVEVKDLQKGDIIVVSTGEQTPVDGIIMEGEAMIDQQSLTGEAAPVDKSSGDNVFATTVLVSGKIEVQVQETGEETLASKIIQIINEASGFQVKIQSSGEKFADKMTLPTLGLGTLGCATVGPNAMLAIINADYGTGIRVAAPIALLASLGVAAKNGLLIKDSKVFEVLQEIDVVLFDKTGTLTTDTPEISDIISANSNYSTDDILFYTATAEQKFTHPIARAILEKAKKIGMTLPKNQDSHYNVGLGIEVEVNKKMIKVGSARYMERENIIIPDIIAMALEKAQSKGQTGILTAIDNHVAGMIELKSTIRAEAAQVISDLKREGIKEIIVISGDHEAPTKELAQELGIDRYFAGVLPHEKADYVKLLQEEGKKVMMVGDGINDSAALSYADIAVSLKGASTIAVDVADVIFMDGSLKNFQYLFDITHTLQQNVQRSFYLVAIPNTLCIVGAFMGVFGFRGSLILNNGFNLIAAGNGMLPYTKKQTNGV